VPDIKTPEDKKPDKKSDRAVLFLYHNPDTSDAALAQYTGAEDVVTQLLSSRGLTGSQYVTLVSNCLGNKK